MTQKVLDYSGHLFCARLLLQMQFLKLHTFCPPTTLESRLSSSSELQRDKDI